MCLAEELPKGSTPIDVVCSPGFFRNDWNEEPRLLEPRQSLPRITPSPAGELTYWKKLAMDAGWAGRLQQDVKDDLNTRVNVIVSPDADVIQLIREATTILPPEQTWNATFNTYYHIGVSQDTRCAWRFCLAESDILRDLLRDRKARLLDLTAERLPEIDPVTPLVEAARTGIRFVESLYPGRIPFSPTSAIKQSHSEGIADKMSPTGAQDRHTAPARAKPPKGSRPQPSSGASRQQRGVPWPAFAAVAAFVAILGTIAIVKVVSPPPPVAAEKTNTQRPRKTEVSDSELFNHGNVQPPGITDDTMIKTETVPAPSEIPPSDQGKKTETTTVPIVVPPIKPLAPAPPPKVTVPIARNTTITFVTISSNQYTKLDLPWQVKLTSGQIIFMSSAGEHLKVSKSTQAGGPTVYNLNKPNQYQELRESAPKQLEFGGGAGHQLPFLVELPASAESETNDHLFVICPRTDFVASLITNPAASSVTLQLEESSEAFSHLAKVVTNLRWTVQIAGDAHDIACKPPVFGDKTVELHNAELFAKNEEANSRRRQFAAEMSKPSLEKKQVIQFLKSLPHELLSGSLADPLRKLPADILRARVKSLDDILNQSVPNGTRSRQTLERLIKEQNNSLNTLTKKLDDLKLKDAVKKLFEARKKIKILEEAEANRNKASRHLDHVMNDKKLSDQIPSAKQHLENAEKDLAKTRLECGSCKDDEIKYTKHTFWKEFEKVAERIEQTKAEIAPLSDELAELNKSEKKGKHLKEERDELTKLFKCLDEKTLPSVELTQLLTDPKYLKSDPQVIADIQTSVVAFFKEGKGNDLIAEHTRERMNISKVSVLSGDTLIAAISIVEGKRDNHAKSSF